jgi:predicted Rossmann fold flavoprotein
MRFTKKVKHDIVVIGGGAAGMLTAAVAAEQGASVALVEKNDRLGLKLRITGKGRCNLTNNCSVEKLMENIPQNAKFLYSAFNSFTPADTMALFTKLGVELKTERGDRVFPVSDNANDVADALIRYMKREGVLVIKARASRILTEAGHVSAVKTDKEIIPCRAAIICTGGLSYPKTGSSGDGLKMAEELGHTIIQPRPSLIALETVDDFCPRMQGLSLKNVTLSVYNKKGKLIYRDLGEMQFTHFGVTGPLVLSASAHMRDFKNDKYTMKIDLKPGLDEAKLDARLIRDFEKYANRDFKNALADISIGLMIPILVERSGIPEETKVNSITKEQRRGLNQLLKEFTLEITGTRPIDEAIITSGGVSTKNINPASMESKLIKGLFFAGEIIDVDAYTGGHNLQIAWSTAVLAGKSASELKADVKDA